MDMQDDCSIICLHFRAQNYL